MSLWKNYKIYIHCLSNHSAYYINCKFKKNENKNITTKQITLLPSKAGIDYTAIPLETKQGLFSHTALSEEENLPWSGMNLCNVIQNEHVDEKDWFCIVGWTLSWWPWAKPEYTCRTIDKKDSNSFLISLIMWFLDLSINLF